MQSDEPTEVRLIFKKEIASNAVVESSRILRHFYGFCKIGRAKGYYLPKQNGK
jgi:hypothetical protein